MANKQHKLKILRNYIHELCNDFKDDEEILKELKKYHKMFSKDNDTLKTEFLQHISDIEEYYKKSYPIFAFKGDVNSENYKMYKLCKFINYLFAWAKDGILNNCENNDDYYFPFELYEYNPKITKKIIIPYLKNAMNYNMDWYFRYSVVAEPLLGLSQLLKNYESLIEQVCDEGIINSCDLKAYLEIEKQHRELKNIFDNTDDYFNNIEKSVARMISAKMFDYDIEEQE